MIGNVLIAIGGMAPAMAGSFVTMGLPDLLYLSELIGVILMYIGFIQATKAPACASRTRSGRLTTRSSQQTSEVSKTSEVSFTGFSTVHFNHEYHELANNTNVF